ncbi:2Fe-2S iron-sulfur cluster-binding protein [Undibacterium sp. 5I1]|uniref:2Fe-2S iron-sulfur cluster-binding protein n=1 Tax=unclassified Undibacterium TaxID=2630295 RepID=UPI002AB3B811|nr:MULTISPECIES: 2Fe-2S iron-sulfur cluster-binding protein [unclassified Undibacterium]MDY7537435.1 2Fe-2S iron-sulfur cluster-binding protein [Undibacterium sp. 5I1]MEB0232081.1 2Fe-2S iron-sulfur cluster-binding protein [Undibacterium sp. 10I3]MEB0259370.1 2Fe-2S iron-sulfur cluster-binding protein [Undibacterium sp. 5I1]
MSDTEQGFQVHLLKQDLVFPIRSSMSVLEAAQFAGISFPSSCRNGTCRACLCHMLSGSVDYRIEWPGLSFDEKSDGAILPCVAQARSDLVLDVLNVTYAVSVAGHTDS